MYGKWVTLDLGDGFEGRVFVFCTPDTPADELKHRAFDMLRRRMTGTEILGGVRV